MNPHLFALLNYSHGKGWPLLSAIVVNKKHVDSGQMEPSTIKGFVEAARELGYTVTDEEAFVKEQQNRVFEWAKGNGTPSPQD